MHTVIRFYSIFPPRVFYLSSARPFLRRNLNVGKKKKNTTYGRTCFVDDDNVRPPNHYRPHDNSRIGSQLDGMDAGCVGGRNAIAHRQPL